MIHTSEAKFELKFDILYPTRHSEPSTISISSIPPMDPSSSMSLPPALHLAMAALLGASFMAISAFYIHRRTVDHVLHRLVEIRRAPPSASEEDGADDDDERSGFGPDGGETDTDTDVRNLSRSVDENLNLLRSYRISSSMPNVASLADWFREDPRNRASSLDNFQSVPLGLPSATNGVNLKSDDD